DLPLVQPTADGLKGILESWDPSAIDIVLLAHNRLKYFEKTVDALYERTDHPFRLIVVDNASESDVLAYLDANRARFHRVIRNPENFWTPAFTQGIGLTRSDPFILSDPDLLVPARETTGRCWLTRMVEKMKLYPEMGMLALNLDPANKPDRLPDVYLGKKEPHGDEITLSNVGTVMQTIRRRFFTSPYTTDWQAVDSIRRKGGFVGFVNDLVAYHLGWDEERDYPEHLVKKYHHFNEKYGSEMYRLYTRDPALLVEMGVARQELISVVVLTRDQLEYTKKCADSLFRHTKLPFELIFVDNASEDGTIEYLRALARERSNVKLILNEENLGFPAGCNQGIAASAGDRVVLLNNDAVVGELWLEGLIQAAAGAGVGIVGPRTNYINGSQMFSPVPYDAKSLAGFEGFAGQWREEHRGRVREEHRVIGFCLLINRKVIERIGGLDESYGSGNLEDDDYCMRALIAGFRVLVAEEVFVHHFGHATFDGMQLDYADSIEDNWQVFKRKWRLPEERSPKDGFSPSSDILTQAFEPERHSEPLFSRRIEAAELPDRRGFNIMLADADEKTIEEVLAAFLRAFGEGDEVALHILCGKDIERIQGVVETVINELGLDSENIPDVSLLTAPATPLDLPNYVRAADAVLGSRRALRGAQDLGIPALFEADPEEMRALFSAKLGIPR
ncbi:MAG TPA: glycosyltransferase, partial [Chroococcales cyanobacterium]